MKLSRLLRQRNIIVATLLLLFWIVGTSIWATGQINRLEENAGFQRLYEEAGGLVRDVERQIARNQEDLELIAAMLARSSQPFGADTWNILGSYAAAGTISRLELLLPDDALLTADGQRITAAGLPSFQTEAARGAHITDRESDWLPEGGYVLRHYVPVVQDGETAALLCGVVELGSLPEALSYQPYGGRASLYIIDGATGDMLLDTWHPELGNLWALGERPMAPGYHHEQLRQGLIDGASDYVVFTSNTTGEYLYFYYTPLDVNRWRLALSVPEDVVFSDAYTVRDILHRSLLLAGASFVFYFLWMLRYVRRESNEKQRQLDSLQHIYSVERLLFNAHEEPERIPQALEEIGHMLAAEQVFFWILGQSENWDGFFWSREDVLPPDHTALAACGRRLRAHFEKGHSQFTAERPQDVQALLPETVQIRKLAAVPVEDAEGTLCGILAAGGPALQDTAPALLKGVGFSFSMLCRNMASYHVMKELGERDVLTGLYNRNRYERDLPAYAQLRQAPLACVYVDADGLHELNNTYGHTVGDRMLQTVAGCLRETFGDQTVYRIGGDEFLAFSIGREEAETARLGQEVSAALESQGIHVSIGIQWEPDAASVESLVKDAEQKMYAAKRAYYASSQHDRRRGGAAEST